MKKYLLTFVTVLFLSLLVFSQTITFLERSEDPAKSQNGIIEALRNKGYNVQVSYTPFDFDAFEETDLIIIGHYADGPDFMDLEAWKSLKTPVFILAPHLVINVRLKFMNDPKVLYSWDFEPGLTSETITSGKPVANEDGRYDPIFDGVTTSGQAFDMYKGIHETLGSWIREFPQENNGQALVYLASGHAINTVEMVRWKPGIETYAGSGMIHGGYRSYLAIGASHGNDINLHNYTPATLKLLLNEVKFLLDPAAVGQTPLLDSTIVDNTDGGFSILGTWETSSSSPGFFGTNYSFIHNSNYAGDAVATWTFDITTEGKYVVAVQWAPQEGFSAKDVTYKIKNRSNEWRIENFNQDSILGGDRFVHIDTVDAKIGQLLVEVYASPTGIVCADAALIGRLDVIALPPKAPTELKAISSSQSTIDLSWTDNSDDEDGFKIQRTSDGALFEDLATVEPNVTSYTDEGLPTSATYFYKVRSFNSAGNSSYEGPVQASTLGGMTATDTIIIDNTEGGFSVTGTWGTSQYSPGFYGINYRYSATGPYGLRVATWAFDIEEEGTYEVSVQWAPQDGFRAQDIQYTIKNRANEWVITGFNQNRPLGHRFVPLDTVDVKTGQLLLEVSCSPTGYVVADAARILRLLSTSAIENEEANISIYPNPVSNRLTISGSDDLSKYKLELYNICGKKVYMNNNLDKSRHQMNMSDYPTGIYLVKMVGKGKQQFIRKIVKE